MSKQGIRYMITKEFWGLPDYTGGGLGHWLRNRWLFLRLRMGYKASLSEMLRAKKVYLDDFGSKEASAEELLDIIGSLRSSVKA